MTEFQLFKIMVCAIVMAWALPQLYVLIWVNRKENRKHRREVLRALPERTHSGYMREGDITHFPSDEEISDYNNRKLTGLIKRESDRYEQMSADLSEMRTKCHLTNKRYVDEGMRLKKIPIYVDIDSS